jgi:hypothetical protein
MRLATQRSDELWDPSRERIYTAKQPASAALTPTLWIESLKDNVQSTDFTG